jgi:hypothetical protein
MTDLLRKYRKQLAVASVLVIVALLWLLVHATNPALLNSGPFWGAIGVSIGTLEVLAVLAAFIRSRFRKSRS